MNRRSFWVVATIAAVAVVLAIIGQSRPSTNANAGAVLLPGLLDALNDVDRVIVRRAGAQIVATLERNDDQWVVVEKNGYAADIGTIREALVALGEARILEEKTADADYYARLGVEAIELESASGTSISIVGAGTATFPDVILGDTANESQRYARRADEARSFLIDRNPEIPRNTAQWLVPDIIDVRSDRVQQVTIEHPENERVVLSKENRGQTNFTVADVPEGRELLYPGVANVVGGALRELRLEDVTGAEQVDPESAVLIEYRTFDGLVVSLTGFSDEAGKNWITLAARFDAQQAVTFANEAVDDDLEATEPAAADPRTEAEGINARVAGWRYSIPAHQFEQLTRRQADLLQAAD